MAGSALWLWSSPDASRALRTRELSQILRTYRRLHGLSQEQLGALLDYDKTYISMIETRRREISDVEALRRIARTLTIPTHSLGVTETDDTTFTTMMQFASSVLSLADVARRSGHASAAVDELWPLVARLESRAAEGLIERDSLAVLARARLSLGLALGNLLPGKDMASAATWTGRAVLVTRHLDDPAFATEALTMHGNELRKAGRVAASISRLQDAVARSTDAAAAATACAMLARAAGEAGRVDLFDDTMNEFRKNLDRARGAGVLANEFIFREVLLRGLTRTNRASRAIALLRRSKVSSAPATPQWTAIELITVAEVLLAARAREDAESALATGLRYAETARLPQQVQRVRRIACAGRLDAVAHAGRDAEKRLATLMAGR